MEKDFKNIGEYLLSKIDSFGSNTALIINDSKVSYEELSKEVGNKISFFQQRNLRIEDRCLILLPDSLELIAGFIACLYLGYLPVPILEATRFEDILYIINDCEPKTVLTNEFWEGKLKEIISQSCSIIVSSYSKDESKKCFAQAALRGDFDPAFLLYTSGSTGQPKGVVHKQIDIKSITENFAVKTLGVAQNDLILSTSSLAFAYGLGVSFYMPILCGATSIILNEKDVFSVIAAIEKYKPSLFFSLPVIYEQILNLNNYQDLSSKNIFSHLRFMCSAGEHLPELVSKKWKDEFQIEILNAMGSTEVSNIFITNIPGHNRKGSCGFPIENCQVEIRDRNENPVPENEMGELWVNCESLMLGYWNKEKKSWDPPFEKGFYTGDLFLRDAEGFFWFKGRKNSLFKKKGRWVSCQEIEEVINQVGCVEKVIVTHNHHYESLIVAHLLLIKHSDKEESIRKIKDFLREKMPRYKRPNVFRFIEKFPKTSTGKINKKELMQYVPD